MRNPKIGDTVKVVVEGLITKDYRELGLDAKAFLSTLEAVAVTAIEVIKVFPATLPTKRYAQVLEKNDRVLWTRECLDGEYEAVYEWFSNGGDYTNTADLAEEIEDFRVISEGVDE